MGDISEIACTISIIGKACFCVAASKNLLFIGII